MATELVILPRKEFYKKYGHSTIGICTSDGNGGARIILRKGVGSRVKLHEYAHAKLGHFKRASDAITDDEIMEQEITADLWVYNLLGRTPSLAELTSDFSAALEWYIANGYGVCALFEWVLERLHTVAGKVLTQDERSRVWWWLREKYDDRRTIKEEQRNGA